jgi:hypothetical protein
MSTTVTTNTITTAQSALDRAASEKRLQELLAAQLRLAEMNRKGSTNTSILGKAPTDTADAKTLSMLITIGTTLILAFMGLIFIWFYRGNRILVLIASCVYIALYGAFVMYVTNQVDQDDCFQDKTAVLLMKGSTIMVLFVAIMIALATVLLPLIEPKKPDGPGGPGGPNGQGGPGRQFNNPQQNGEFGGRRGRARGRNGFQGDGFRGNDGPRGNDSGFRGNDGPRGNDNGFRGNDGPRGNDNGFRGNDRGRGNDFRY